MLQSVGRHRGTKAPYSSEQAGLAELYFQMLPVSLPCLSVIERVYVEACVDDYLQRDEDDDHLLCCSAAALVAYLLHRVQGTGED